MTHNNTVNFPRSEDHFGDGWVIDPDGQAYWGIFGAAGLLVARTDAAHKLSHIILQHRSHWGSDGGLWGIPGGAIALGETPVEGAVRESFEEAHIEPDDIVIVGTSVYSKEVWEYTTVLALESPTSTINPRVGDNESIAVQWVAIDTLKDYALVGPLADQLESFLATLQRAAR